MQKIKEFLEKEVEREKKLLFEDFEKRKREIKEDWERKIKEMEEDFSSLFLKKKEEFIEKEKQRIKINLGETLNKVKNEFWNSFFEEGKEILKELEREKKEEILKIVLSELKKILPVAKGSFVVARGFTKIIRNLFPGAEIKETDNFSFGFLYSDKEIEIEANEEAIVKKFMENYILI